MINKNSVDEPRILRDAIIDLIKNNGTAFASGLNKSQLKKIAELEMLLFALVFSTNSLDQVAIFPKSRQNLTY